MENKLDPEKGYIQYIPPLNAPQNQGTSIGDPIGCWIEPNEIKEVHSSMLDFCAGVLGVVIVQDPRPKPKPEPPKEAPPEVQPAEVAEELAELPEPAKEPKKARGGK